MEVNMEENINDPAYMELKQTTPYRSPEEQAIVTKIGNGFLVSTSIHSQNKYIFFYFNLDSVKEKLEEIFK